MSIKIIKLCLCFLLYETGLYPSELKTNSERVPKISDRFRDNPAPGISLEKVGVYARPPHPLRFFHHERNLCTGKILFFLNIPRHTTTDFGHNSIINAKLGLTFGDLYYIILCIFIAKHLYKPRMY